MSTLRGSDISTLIIDKHREILSARLISLIACGSLHTKRFRPSSDVDYVLVVDQIDQKVLYEASRIRHEIEIISKLEISNTILSQTDLEKFEDTMPLLDPKAVQAVIEAGDSRKILYSAEQDLIPTPSSALISQFSRLNYHSLRSTIRKMLVRTTQHPIDLPLLVKLSKMTIILFKLQVQYKHPDIFTTEYDYDNVLELHLSTREYEFYEELRGIKDGIVSDQESISAIAEKIIHYWESRSDHFTNRSSTI